MKQSQGMIRAALFLLGCIGTRLALTGAAFHHPAVIGAAALLASVGMLSIYLFKLRPSGWEAGGPIWWDHLRPLHAALLGLFAMMALTGVHGAWIVLLLDTMVGLAAWTIRQSRVV